MNKDLCTQDECQNLTKTYKTPLNAFSAMRSM